MKLSDTKKVREKIHQLLGVEFLEEIRHQGYNYVYQGVMVDPSAMIPERKVVVKMLGESLSHDEIVRKKFEDEANIYRSLNHDSIVKIVLSETIQFDGSLGLQRVIIMEYIDGLSVKDICAEYALRGEFLPIGIAIQIIIKILMALDYLHNLKVGGKNIGLVHSDVSPSNILLSKGGQVKIIDFGIVHSGSDLSPRLFGKMAYMSPEHLEGKLIDHRSDIFGVSLVFAEILSSQRMQVGVSKEEVLENIQALNYPALKKAQIDTKLIDIVLKGLAFNPEERFQTSVKMIEALSLYAKEKNISLNPYDLVKFIQDIHRFSGDKTLYDQKELPSSTEEKNKKWGLGFFPYFIGTVLALVLMIWFLKQISYQERVNENAKFRKSDSVMTPIVSKEEKEIKKTADDEMVTEKIWNPKISITAPSAFIKITYKGQVWTGTSFLKVSDLDIEAGLANAKFKLSVSRKGYKSKFYHIVLTPEKSDYLQKIELEKKKTGRLFVGATPWAEVTISGYVNNKEIPFTIDLPEGKHRVVAKYQDSNGKRYRVSGGITIKPGGEHKCLASFEGDDGMKCW